MLAEAIELVRDGATIEANRAATNVDAPFLVEAAMFMAEAAAVSCRQAPREQLRRQGSGYLPTAMHPDSLSVQRSYPGSALAGRCCASSLAGLA